MDHKYGRSVRVSENSPSWGAQILQFFECFNKTIIPLALVGYEIVIANPRAWNNC